MKLFYWYPPFNRIWFYPAYPDAFKKVNLFPHYVGQSG